MDFVRPIATRKVIRDGTEARSEVRGAQGTHLIPSTLTITQLRRSANYPLWRIGFKSLARGTTVIE